MKTKKLKLKNGLSVILIESHKSPVVSVQMWVKTGSADEKKGEEGISHFIEHLVFKGTEKFKTNEIAAIVEGSGGELNAYTSFDQTVFYVTISKAFRAVAIDVVSQMMGFPLFDAQEIDNEREVVIEEIKRGLDSPARRSSQLMFSTAYKKHPYGIPVIGYEKNIKKFSPQKIKKFYQDRYNPNNMCLVVAGDFDAKEMLKEIEPYFLRFPKNKLRKVVRAKEPAQKKSRFSHELSTFEQSQIYLSWSGPNVKHKDVVALDVLALILGQGDSSRLTQALRLKQPVVAGVGAFSYSPQDAGLFALQLGLDEDKIEIALKEVAKEIHKICTQPITNEELQKAVTIISSEQVYSVETVDGLAKKAGSLEFYFNDHRAYEKYLKTLQSLKPVDILKIAKKYLKNETLCVSFFTKANKKTCENNYKILIRELSHKSKPQKIKLLPKEKFKKPKLLKFKHKVSGKSEFNELVLSNGLKLIMKRIDDTPTCSARIVIPGGSRVDGTTKPGRTELFSRVWGCETKSMNEEELNHKIESLAAGLSTFSGRNTIGVNIECLSNAQGEILDIAKEFFIDPVFNEALINREKTSLLQQLKSRKDSPTFWCSKYFSEKMYPGHIYGIDPFENEEKLKTYNKDDLKEYFASVPLSGNSSLCIVGDFDEKLWINFFESLPIKKDFKVSDIVEPKKLSDNVRFHHQMKKEQTHVMFGFRSLPLSDERRSTLEVMESILSGMGGRLFYELREKNSLAYTVSPIKFEGIGTGYFGAYIGCSPEKVDKSISMMRDEFNKLQKHLVSDDELMRAKQYLIGSSDIDLQRKSALCNVVAFNDIYKIDYRKVLDAQTRYSSVTADQIKKLANEIFSGHEVIITVGS